MLRTEGRIPVEAGRNFVNGDETGRCLANRRDTAVTMFFGVDSAGDDQGRLQCPAAGRRLRQKQTSSPGLVCDSGKEREGEDRDRNGWWAGGFHQRDAEDRQMGGNSGLTFSAIQSERMRRAASPLDVHRMLLEREGRGDVV